MLIAISLNETKADTARFEECYEEELQCDDDERTNLLLRGTPTWLKVDGKLAGEAITILPSNCEEDIEDVDRTNWFYHYWYTTTILPQYRGKGLAEALVAYHIARLRIMRVRGIMGHATTPAMRHIREKFGAKVLKEHKNWYGTGRTAYFYVQTL